MNTEKDFLETIYNLPFGKSYSFFGGTKVMRVPGGWIFSDILKKGNEIITESSVFVPYSTEGLEENDENFK